MPTAALAGIPSLEALVHQLGQRHAPLGVAIAMVREATITYARAFGCYGEQDLALDTPLPVASLSKPVFAYAVLQIVEQGVLDLDTPLVRYLPDAYLPDEPYAPPLTARHALSHTTGLPNWRDASGLRAAFTLARRSTTR